MVRHITSLAPLASFPGCTARALSQVCRVSPLGRWSQAVTLLADVSHPGSQEDVVSNWQPAPCLVEDAVSGAMIASRLLALAVACLPLHLPWGLEPVCSLIAFLRCWLNPLFCEWASLCLRLELFFLSLSFLFFPLSLFSFFPSLSGSPTVSVAISRSLPQIVLRAFRTGP